MKRRIERVGRPKGRWPQYRLIVDGVDVGGIRRGHSGSGKYGHHDTWYADERVGKPTREEAEKFLIDWAVRVHVLPSDEDLAAVKPKPKKEKREEGWSPGGFFRKVQVMEGRPMVFAEDLPPSDPRRIAWEAERVKDYQEEIQEDIYAKRRASASKHSHVAYDDFMAAMGFEWQLLPSEYDRGYTETWVLVGPEGPEDPPIAEVVIYHGSPGSVAEVEGYFKGQAFGPLRRTTGREEAKQVLEREAGIARGLAGMKKDNPHVKMEGWPTPFNVDGKFHKYWSGLYYVAKSDGIWMFEKVYEGKGYWNVLPPWGGILDSLDTLKDIKRIYG